jgi:hypothetical protein
VVFSWSVVGRSNASSCAVSITSYMTAPGYQNPTTTCVTPANPSNENHLTTVNGGAVTSDVVWGNAVAGQNGTVQPVLQLADGSFVGYAFDGNGGQYMVAFDASGKVKWTVPGYSPDIATADGGIIGDFGGS